MQQRANQEMEAMAPSPSHMTSPINTAQVSYGCHKCYAVLTTRKLFARHMYEKCEKLQVWQCPICLREFTRFTTLHKHHHKFHVEEDEDDEDDDRGIDMEACKRPVRPKLVLGCGYCVQSFEETRNFVQHLATHLQQGYSISQWSPTTRVISLLQHPSIKPTWVRVCVMRFGTTEASQWPAMGWRAKDADEEIEELEYGLPSRGLDLCLASLLENGLLSEYPPHRLARLPWTDITYTGYYRPNDNVTSEASNLYYSRPRSAFAVDTEVSTNDARDVYHSSDLGHPSLRPAQDPSISWAPWADISAQLEDRSTVEHETTMPCFMLDFIHDNDLNLMDNERFITGTTSSTQHTDGQMSNLMSFGDATPVSPGGNVEDMIMNDLPAADFTGSIRSSSNVLYAMGSIAPADSMLHSAILHPDALRDTAPDPIPASLPYTRVKCTDVQGLNSSRA